MEGIGTARGKVAARRPSRVSQLGQPLFFAVALWPMSSAASEPLYEGLAKFEVIVARDILQDTLEHTPSQETRRWSFESSETRGEVTPLRTFKIRTGHYCREFREAVSSAAHGVRSADQIACRNDAGHWIRVDP